jgi:PAS domain S-box-containing protein
VASTLALMLLGVATGERWSTPLAIGTMVAWLTTALVSARLIPRLENDRAAERFSFGTSVIDVVLLTLGLFGADGSWWQGATFHLVVVAASAITLRPRAVGAISAVAALALATLYFTEAAGIVVQPKGPETPSLVGRWVGAAWNIAFNWVAFVLCYGMLRMFTRRYGRSRERYRRLFDAAPYATLTVDADGAIVSANPAAGRLGLAENEAAPTRRFIDIVPVAERAVVARALASALAGTQGTTEHAALAPGGETRWLRTTFTPACGTRGTQVLVTAVDITEEHVQREARERLRAEVEAGRRMRLVGQMVSGVAHELNNPLAAVLNYAELLRAETRPPADAEALDVIHTQALRARAVVRDLLQVARAPAPRDRATASLDEIVRAALVPLARRAADAGTHLALDVTGELRPQPLDVAGVGQVVTNLVVNALDAARRGRVVVRVDPHDDGGSVLTVEDSGPGLEPDVLAHLFEPFFSTKETGRGTGLGLAVARGICEQHGGTLVAENMGQGPGNGARFVATFPEIEAGLAPVPSPASTPPAGTRVAQGAGRVLVVDDEAAVRGAIVRMLRTDGWTAQEAGDPHAALALLQSDEGAEFVVIVTDVRMPGLDGPSLHAALAATHPDRAARVIFATGDTASLDVRVALGAAGRPVLEKPFPRRALLDLVHAVAGEGARSTAE